LSPNGVSLNQDEAYLRNYLFHNANLANSPELEAVKDQLTDITAGK
jgi:hypothetical protein